MESPTVPRHLVASEGRVFPKFDSAIRNYVPKQIDYRHTIRVITPFQCSHEDELQQLRLEKEAAVKEKEREIERVEAMLKEMTEELQRRNEEIERLKEAKRQNSFNQLKVSTLNDKLERSQVTDIFHSNIKSHRDHCFSNIKTSFIFDISSEAQPFKEANQMEQELQNMENNLKELAEALNKPKRVYQFYTKPKEEPIPTLPVKIEMFQRKIDVSEQAQQQQEFDDNDEEDESAECTSTNESFDASDFFEEAINQHKVLRDTLIELEQSTKAEMQQMRQYYEKEIEGYRRMLKIQRDKTSKTLKGQHRIIQMEFASILGAISGLENRSNLLDND